MPNHNAGVVHFGDLRHSVTPLCVSRLAAPKQAFRRPPQSGTSPTHEGQTKTEPGGRLRLKITSLPPAVHLKAKHPGKWSYHARDNPRAEAVTGSAGVQKQYQEVVPALAASWLLVGCLDTTAIVLPYSSVRMVEKWRFCGNLGQRYLVLTLLGKACLTCRSC